jgi:hypothetical protein
VRKIEFFEEYLQRKPTLVLWGCVEVVSHIISQGLVSCGSIVVQSVVQDRWRSKQILVREVLDGDIQSRTLIAKDRGRKYEDGVFAGWGGWVTGKNAKT